MSLSKKAIVEETIENALWSFQSVTDALTLLKETAKNDKDGEKHLKGMLYTLDLIFQDMRANIDDFEKETNLILLEFERPEQTHSSRPDGDCAESD